MLNKIKPFLIVAILAVIILIGIFYYNYNPLNSNIFPKCPFFSITGLYCPGCGSQRAIHNLLHGNIIKAFGYNFMILLLVIVISYDFIILLINKLFKGTLKNLLHKPITTISILIFVICFWFLRNIDKYPFTILAP